MSWLSAVILLSVLTLAGCGNTGNPNAPVSTAPHEKTWMTYHRNDIVSFKGITTARPAADGLLVKEHVFQCQLCHGAGLMGVRSGAAGPACLDCHVLDPVKYPVLCYSCHGGYPNAVMNPQQWYSTNRDKRAGLSLDSRFINRVRNSSNIHLKHDAIAINGISGIPIDKCSNCHGGPNNIGEPHHTIVLNDPKFNPPLGCLGPLPFGCHSFGFTPGGFTLITPDCSFCHSDLLQKTVLK